MYNYYNEDSSIPSMPGIPGLEATQESCMDSQRNPENVRFNENGCLVFM